MRLQKVIEQLGYKPNEARVYLAVLHLGDAMATDIARRTALPRTTVLSILESLCQAGIVSFYEKRRYRYWVAESPERLLARLHEREAELRTALPKLSALRKTEQDTPSVCVYIGAEEIKHVFDDVLETKQHTSAVLPHDHWWDFFGEGYFDEFMESQVSHFLHSRILTPETTLTTTLKKKDSAQLRETRFLPKEAAFTNALYLYGTKVALISLNEIRPTAVVVDDRSTHDMMTVFFEELWNRYR